MIKVQSVELRGKLTIGPVDFLRAEWWSQAPRFVLLRISLYGKEQEHGIRLDIDKKAILDSVGDDYWDRELQQNAVKIWQTSASVCRVIS